jgi:hypothetical protein
MIRPSSGASWTCWPRARPSLNKPPGSQEQLKADRKQKAQVKAPSVVTTTDVSEEVLKRGRVIQLAVNFAFRANTAVVARKYLLDGFSIVHNEKTEKRLGPGLYAGMKIEYARAYVDRLKDLPAIVQLLFTEPATGIEVRPEHMELLDGMGVDAMQRIYDEYDFIYCNDAVGGQIKFHPRYYLTRIKIGQVRVRVNKSADKWEEYAPDVFLQYYESSHVNLRTGVAKQRGAQPKAVAPIEPPSGAWTQALKEAPDAEKWMVESIRFATPQSGSRPTSHDMPAATSSR